MGRRIHVTATSNDLMQTTSISNGQFCEKINIVSIGIDCGIETVGRRDPLNGHYNCVTLTLPTTLVRNRKRLSRLQALPVAINFARTRRQRRKRLTNLGIYPSR